jgi:predicted nucleotidyltransferase
MTENKGLPEKEQIVTVLRERFDPQAIILVGSRVDGSATENSDWDTFLFCGERRAGIELTHDGLRIDVNFAAWPQEDQYFDIGFGPVEPVEVLFDNSGNRLPALLENTRVAYEKGPLQIQAEVLALHVRAFHRSLEKLEKYQENQEIQFYYKGKVYDLFLTVWFEQHNEWMPSPARAIEILKTSQPEIFSLLQKFVLSSGEEGVALAKKLSSHISA